MKKLLVLSLLVFSGCISIATHEKQMKKCRDTAVLADQYKTRATALEARNTELEKSLAERSEEHDDLKAEMSNVRNTYDELVQELKDSIAAGDAGVKETKDGLTITLGNQILFQSGKATLQPSGLKVLGKVAGVLRKNKDKLIQVEGHTDNLRIAGSLKERFPSNWELSAARSASVVRFLQETGHIDPSLLMLTAFAENKPVEDNSTPRGRQLNRRVEITLVPKPQ